MMVDVSKQYRRGPFESNGFGIYVHIPFCVHKCSYCDFYSFTRYDETFFTRYVEKLTVEIEQAGTWLREKRGALEPVSSIFIGGGTPSLLPVPLMARIFETLQRVFEVLPEAERTTEANPETITDAFLENLRAQTPINRVSLGAQSFHPQGLKNLERLGSRESIERAAGLLVKHGFENFNLDLIFGIPGLTLEDMERDIEAAAALHPQHVSFYHLTLKPAHSLYTALPSEEAAADFFESGLRKLEALGYAQYEISNFSKPQAQSQHNLLYWDGGDFLGVGASAASRFFWDGVFHHRKQLSDYNAYLEGGAFPAPGFEATNRTETILEATFLELRKSRGIDLTGFGRRYGWEPSQSAKYSLFLKEGLLEREADTLRLTHRGKMLADSVTRDLSV